MNSRSKLAFIGAFLIVTPPVIVLVSALNSVRGERLVREGLATPSPIWDVVFPLALIACFLCIPLGGYLIYKALRPEP